MKAKEIRELSDERLDKMLSELRLAQIKATSEWGLGKTTSKEIGIKPPAKQGDRTKLQRDIRRNIAKILTIKQERTLKS